MPKVQPRSGERAAEALLVGVMLIWAANYPVTKYSLQVLDVYTFNAIRFVVAFCLLFGILAYQHAWFRIPVADRMPFLRLGFVLTILYQLAFIFGIKRTSSGNAAVILSTSPIWTALLNSYINKERLQRKTVVGLAVALGGVVLIIVGSGKQLEFGSGALWGDCFMLASAMLWALSTTWQKPLLARYSTIQLSVVTLGMGAVGLSAISIPAAAELPWRVIPISYYGAAILSGALSIGTANVLWTHGVQRLGPSRTANFNNLVPIFAFLISYVTLGEPITWFQISGTIITLIGVTVVRR